MTNEIFDKPVTPSLPRSARWLFGGAIAISLLMHAIIGVALLDRIEERLPEQDEAPVLVEMVPLLEPEEPEPEPEEPEPEEPEPEELEPETPETEASEPAPQPEAQPQSGEPLNASPPALPALRPVYEFAEKDTGPETNPDGVSAKEPNEPEQTEPDTSEAERQSADTEPSEAIQNDVVETPNEQEPDLLATSDSAPDSQQIAAADATVDNTDPAGPITALVTPTPKPAATTPEETQDPEAMTPVKQLYSEAILNDPSFRTAMDGMPRSLRASLLCMTEMRDQLRAARRPPEVLPTYRLPAGTVMEPSRAAFRTQGQWFDLAFRCEVDLDVTRVLKFSYRVGDAIPRAQWSQRGFPNL